MSDTSEQPPRKKRELLMSRKKVVDKFISADYAAKAWTRHERRSALARAVEEDEYVLPARFDDTELPGFRPTIGYVDLREIAPATLVEFVIRTCEAPDDS